MDITEQPSSKASIFIKKPEHIQATDISHGGLCIEFGTWPTRMNVHLEGIEVVEALIDALNVELIKMRETV